MEFEYFCAGGVPAFALLPGPPFQAKTARMLPAIGHSETWSTYAARIAPPGKPLPEGWRELRMDLPLPKDRVLQVRNARLRPERPGEFATAIAKPSAEIIATFEGGLAPRKPLKDYLAAGVAITAKDSDVTLPADDAQVGLPDAAGDAVQNRPVGAGLGDGHVVELDHRSILDGGVARPGTARNAAESKASGGSVGGRNGEAGAFITCGTPYCEAR